MKHPTPTVVILLILNALLFVATYMVPNQAERMLEALALHFPQSDPFRPWQFLSYMFMHGSLGHLVFNMFGLYLFGGALERVWGAPRFLVLYFMAGIGAALISSGIDWYQFQTHYRELLTLGLTEEQLQRFLDTGRIEASLVAQEASSALLELRQAYFSRMVGASGAIYGILVAFAILFPNAKLALIFFPMPVAAKYFVPALLLLDLFSGVTGFSLFGGGIAHFAHIGGALIGFLLMLYWRLRRPERAHQPAPSVFR